MSSTKDHMSKHLPNLSAVSTTPFRGAAERTKGRGKWVCEMGITISDTGHQGYQKSVETGKGKDGHMWAMMRSSQMH